MDCLQISSAHTPTDTESDNDCAWESSLAGQNVCRGIVCCLVFSGSFCFSLFPCPCCIILCVHLLCSLERVAVVKKKEVVPVNLDWLYGMVWFDCYDTSGGIVVESGFVSSC